MPGRYSRAPQHPAHHRAPSVPIHRGPQAMNPSAAPMGGFHHAPNAALLIDFDNVTMGIRSDLDRELRTLLSSDIIKGKVAVQRAYADWRRYQQYVTPLTASSIDLIFAPAYGSAKKNATDIRLAIDALELVFTRPEIGTFILLSGDSDFTSLVIKLKEYGKYIIGVGIRESSSDLLVQSCDEYYSYNALAGLQKSGDEDNVPKYDPWELVTEALNKMKRNGDVMRSDRLKQVMQEIDNAFDEKNLGMSKFSRFVQEAASRGVLSTRKLENGQIEVDLAGKGAAPVTAAAAEVRPAETRPAPSGDAAAERPRRGRRGGRGRDRTERPRPAGDTAPVAAAASSNEPRFPEPNFAAAAQQPARAERGVEIGVDGERLSRQEAFDLVRKTVEALAPENGKAVRASDVRTRARNILGRDSASLSERNFERILRDAHDGQVIDLRRRGNDFEVALAVQTDSVAQQLGQAEAAATPAPVVAAAAPRGMAHRAGGLRGRSTRGAAGAPPPELLLVGVVEESPSIQPELALEPEEAPKPARAGRKKAAKSASKAEAKPPAAKRKSSRAKRSASEG
jgi:uncharacterized protein (TIGR00288 family)